MVMCLGQGADLHNGPADAIATQYRLLQQIQIGFTFLLLPFWCRLTQVVPDKIQAGRKMVVCVCVCARTRASTICTMHL